jgi:hypothetical protein
MWGSRLQHRVIHVQDTQKTIILAKSCRVQDPLQMASGNEIGCYLASHRIKGAGALSQRPM